MSGQATTRQAANVTVTSATRRYGSYPGGYQIINTSLEATVWAADNPSCKSGFGTPISPGTSIVWSTDGELFLCLGSDTQSVAAGNADVVISYDVQNWQPNPIAIAAAILNSGVIVVDQPVVLNNTTILAGGTRGPYDVSRYNSIALDVESLTAANGYLEILWYTDASMSFLVATDHISWATNTNSQWSGQIPCRSAFVFFIANGVSVGNIIVASNRAIDGIQNALTYSAGGDYNLLRNEQILAANSFGTRVYVYPWYGEVDVVSLTFGGGAASDVALAFENYGNLQPVVGGDLITSTNDAQSTLSTLAGPLQFRSRVQRLGLNGQQLVLLPYNNNGVGNVTIRITVMPVPQTKG